MSCYDELTEEAQVAVDYVIDGALDIIANSLHENGDMCLRCITEEIAKGLVRNVAKHGIPPEAVRKVIQNVLDTMHVVKAN
jgi:hypothetical protein